VAGADSHYGPENEPTAVAPRFFFISTLAPPDLTRRLISLRDSPKLPTVLRGEEVAGRCLQPNA
jgi:hypothetical protein